jgi:hypothetical protein
VRSLTKEPAAGATATPEMPQSSSRPDTEKIKK